MNIAIQPVGLISYNRKYQKNCPCFCSGKDCFIKNNSIKQKLLDNNISMIKFDECYNALSKNPDSVDDFIKYRNAAIEYKNHFVSQGEKISSSAIDCFLSTNVEEILTTGKLLGDKNFIYSFNLKMDNFIRFISRVHLLKNTDYFGWLEEQINPQESKIYKTLNNSYLQERNKLLQLGIETGFNEIYLKNNLKIEELKSRISQLKLTHTKENLLEIKQLQENIKYFKKEIFDAKTPEYLQKEEQVFNIKSKMAQMKNSAVKDPQDAITLCNIAYVMNSLKVDINEIKNVLKFNTKNEKLKFYKYLNTKLSYFFNIDYNEEVLQKLKLYESEYFYKIFYMNASEKNDLRKFLKILSDNPKASVAQNLDNLTQNIKTKQIFEQNGINYDLYVNPDENCILNIKAKRQLKPKDAVIKNITTDIVNLLSSDSEAVPSHNRAIIKSKLEENNFKLVDKNGDIEYDEGLNSIKMMEPPVVLCRNNNPANYKDIVDLHKILKDIVSNTRSFIDGSSFESLTFAQHIGILRTNEIAAANYVYPQNDFNLKVKQIDMNDIKHSLFLGNQAHCCTAIGSGFNQDTAIKYIKNKFISGIEILDGDKYVGNTILFFAKVDDKLSLIIDNIEMASEYQYVDEVRDGIIKFAKILADRVGQPDIPIYAGIYDSKCDMSKYLFKYYNLEILGSSGEDAIYLDFIRERQKLDNTAFGAYLYKIE